MKVWIVWDRSTGTKELWNIYVTETQANQDAAVMNDFAHKSFFDVSDFYWVEEWPIAGLGYDE